MKIVNQTPEPIEVGVIYDAVNCKQFKITRTAEVGNPLVIHFEGQWNEKSWKERKKKMPERFKEE